jgi:DnaJ-class molecular chaperone
MGFSGMTRQQALLTLGLSTSAREAEIRRAWRKKAKFFHPDAPYGNVTAFLQAKDAFETLIPPAPQSVRVRAGGRAF